MQQITIAHRFRGPATSANGGYAAGYLSRFIEGAVEVTLRAPPPLDRPLDVIEADGKIELRADDVLLAEAGSTTLDDLHVLAGPDLAGANAARDKAYDFGTSDFNECFTCSRNRTPDDALCLWAGPVPDATDHLHATPWQVHESLSDFNGAVAPEFVWAALDCPGIHSLFSNGVVGQYTLLGRMACEIFDRPQRGDICIVASWPGKTEGRKHFATTALFHQDGTLMAKARQTWISIPDPNTP